MKLTKRILQHLAPGELFGPSAPHALHGTYMIGVVPTGDLVSGIVMQAPSTTWGEPTDGGEANADYAKGQFLVCYKAPVGGEDSNLDSLLLRINHEGSIGMLGGIHLMYGRNGALDAGQGWGQVLWSNPQVDVPHLVLTRQALAAAQPFLLATTEAGVTLFRLDADGVMRASFVADIQNLGPYLQFNSNGMLLKNRDAAHTLLSLQSISGQTADIFDLHTTDARIFALTSAALPYTKGASSGYQMFDRDNNAKNFLIYPNAEYLRIFAGADRVIFGRGAAQYGQMLKQVASQSVDIFRIEPSGSTTPFLRVDKNGLLIVKSLAAPADADLGTSELALRWNDTAGTPTVDYKGKDSAGTVVSGSLSKSPDVQRFTSSGTYTKPAGAKLIEIIIQAAGGGGQGGARRVAGAAGLGGSGGGGGARIQRVLQAAAIGATEAITIGAAGTGGIGATVDGGGGVVGTDAGDSSFGSILTAGGGLAPQSATNPGDGGGVFGMISGAGVDGIGGQGALCTNQTPRNAEWGGGSGACDATGGGTGIAGGSSAHGGPGGGGGGGVTTTNVAAAGGQGGGKGYVSGGGGPAGAAAAAAAAATTGGNGLAGTAGGGGGGNAAGVGGRGADGGFGAGGGGGGAGTGANGGRGGDGGPAEIIVIAYF